MSSCAYRVVGLWLGAVLLSGSARAAQEGGLALRFSVQSQPSTVIVSGTVRDKHTGNPIPDATVRAHMVIDKLRGPDLFERCPYQEGVADVNGQYQFTFVTPLTGGASGNDDALCVEATAPGYETQPQYARPGVTPNHCVYTNFDFALKPGKRLNGVVTTADGQAVAGALLRLQNGLNGDWNYFGSMGRAVTAADGSFELWISSDDTDDYSGKGAWLCVWKQGVGNKFIFKVLEQPDLGTVVLNPGGEVTGKVLDVSGNPVPNCELRIGWGFLPLADKTLSDSQGNYRLKGVPGESTIREFVKNRGRTYEPRNARANVYARPTPEMELKSAPHFEIVAQDGQTVTAPDLVVGAQASVSGTLVRSRTALSLGGLLVRLDGSWENMVEADMNGQFVFPYVAPGKHTLTAYLPHNLRYDRGIGQTKIEVQSGAPLKDVQIQLADLAELRVQYLDLNGNPLPGITAATAWSRSGEGGWTQGTMSDDGGWAVLYLYPDSVQYLRGFDRSQKLTAELPTEITPRPGEVMQPMQVVMVPTAKLSGRLVDEQAKPLGAKPVLCTLLTADGAEYRQGFKTDDDGRFTMDRITPGILRFRLEIQGVVFDDALEKALEVRPAASEELGTIVLRNGLDKAKVIREKHADKAAQSREVPQAAGEFFEKIRTADYDYFLKPNADWQRFPIVGFYQTHHWFDTLVTWMSSTFKTNPITRVELGEVFSSPKKINGLQGLPAVPYKLTLKDGTVLQGDLPFEYNFDGGKGHWHGLEGVDWHFQKK